MSKKKEQSIASSQEIDSVEESFSLLLDVVVQDSKEHLMEELEPFENYIERVKSKLHQDVPLFRSRFAKGYHVLMEQLKYEQSAHDTPKPNDSHF
jgi:hypothetical protein